MGNGPRSGKSSRYFTNTDVNSAFLLNLVGLSGLRRVVYVYQMADNAAQSNMAGDAP